MKGKAAKVVKGVKFSAFAAFTTFISVHREKCPALRRWSFRDHRNRHPDVTQEHCM
jgi:hypothetical protein